MNELHEKYETLLRRGMPEHPRLEHWSAGWFLHSAGKQSTLRVHVICSPNDAEDLITMHALRWHAGENWQNYAGAMIALSGHISGTNQCPLGAILEATKHLEPEARKP